MYIILAILIFGILIGIHELGHFTAAKALGVKVNEFSIGMGPALFKRQKGETLYALRALPIGGYCAMEGEDEESGDPRALAVQPAWKKLIILVAGSFMNFLLGFVLIIAVFMGGAFSTPTVTGFMDGCPYQGENALQVGDTFYKIDGHRIWFTSNVGQFLDRGDGTYEVTVLRDGEKVTLSDFGLKKLDYPEQETPMYGFNFGVRETGVLASLKYSWFCAMDFVRDVWMALSDLVSGAVGIKDLSGPVGIVNMMNSVGQESAAAGGVGAAISNLVYFGAFIAINLAVMNLLPLPALDGGRVFFLLINGLSALIIKKRIPAKYEGYVHAVGMVLLLGLMAVVMYNDIAGLIAR
jgi:regulator of sigma E protease